MASIPRCCRTRRGSLLLSGGIAQAVVLLWAVGFTAPAAQGRLEGGLGSLKTVAAPAPTGLESYVADQRMLVVLGKALFWDVQVGSDGRTACATCHFHAGADHRRYNALASTPDVSRAVPLNRRLTIEDFPFHQRADPNTSTSRVIRDVRQIAGSPGIAQRQFVDVSTTGGADHAVDAAGQAPEVGGRKIRQVTGRNAPTVINAALNVRNFHDGRASDIFTGLTPFGDSDQAMNAYWTSNGTLEPRRVRIANASLASQAMGPPLSPVEMSYAGRTWPKLGKRMLSVAPLATQQVAPDDSVLGTFANPARPGYGLAAEHTYPTLVRAAFRPELWSSNAVVDASGRVIAGVTAPRSSDEYTQMEMNFAIFFGLAVQTYQSTLISSDSRFDRYAEGDDAALSDLERAGLEEFQGANAKCTLCHGGPELTQAGITSVAANGFDASRVEAFGFFRIAVSPMADDIGAGGNDGFGLPIFPAASRRSVRGTFKAPTLRNVELTGPYLHTGGAATLSHVMEFYNRRGDFRADGNLGAGFADIEIGSRSAGRLIAFMKSLTDDRVRYERAPFDHPSLCVPDGHPEASPGVLSAHPSFPGAPLAADDRVLVPAVGRGGNTVPLQTFEELLLGIGSDGSRAHAMTFLCERSVGLPTP
jgi:cytochrome c peroxidase